MNESPVPHLTQACRLRAFRTGLLPSLLIAMGFSVGCTPLPAVDRRAEDAVKTAGGTIYQNEWFHLIREDIPSANSRSKWISWIGRKWSDDGGDADSFTAVSYDCSQANCRPAEELTVDSCERLFEADSRRLDVPGMGAEQGRYLKHRLECYAARSMAGAMTSKKSFVSGFALTGVGLGSLPPDLGFPVDPQQVEEMIQIRQKGGGLGSFLADVLGVSGNAAEGTAKAVLASDAGNWTREWLYLARGDFDGDGQEDLLIAVNLYITDEMLLFGSKLYVVTRDSTQTPYRIESQISLFGREDTCDHYVEVCTTSVLSHAR